MDSNHDKSLQRALCYHYTTGQTVLKYPSQAEPAMSFQGTSGTANSSAVQQSGPFRVGFGENPARVQFPSKLKRAPMHFFSRHLEIDGWVMVPATGLEPVRCYSLEPESSASANSATRAQDKLRILSTTAWAAGQVKSGRSGFAVNDAPRANPESRRSNLWKSAR